MKLILKIFFSSLFLSFLLAIPRGGAITIFSITGFYLSSIVGFIVLGIWSIFCIHKYKTLLKPRNIIIIIFLGVSIIELVFRVRNFSSTIISFPNLIIWWLGILSGYVVTFISNKIFRMSFIMIIFVTAYLLSVPGYKMFIHYLNFGTFTGVTYEKVAYPIQFQTSQGDEVTFSSSNHAYLILDCWNPYGGVCYQDVPIVRDLYDEIKTDQQFSLYSVHCYMGDKGEDFETGQHILTSRNYTFPTLSLSIKNEMLDSLGVKYYPTVLLLDSCNNIIFKGDIKSVTNKIQEIKLIKNK